MQTLKTYSKVGVTLVINRPPVVSEERFVDDFLQKLDEYLPFDRVLGILELYKWVKTQGWPTKVEYDWTNPWFVIGWILITFFA